MKVLYLTPNFGTYSAAYYQNDLISSLQSKIEIILWGPGYKNFDNTLTLEQIFNKFNLDSNDTVCVGHGWLSDIPQNANAQNRYSWSKDLNRDLSNDLEFCAKYNFADHIGKKVCILNKEYVSLNAKLQFINRGKFDLAFSHYSECEEFEKTANTKFIFFPCSVNKEKFININNRTNLKKKYDLCFSGLLQNPYMKKKNKNLFSLRKKIQSEIFAEILEIPLYLNKSYNKKSIYWNAYQDSSVINKILKILNKYKKLDFNDYAKMFYLSKATLNTLSPFNLIGPRYFECMLLGSVNFCEKSDYYSKIFKEYVHYIPFKADLSDFNEMLDYATSDSKEIKKIIDASYTLVVEKHTYDKRAESLIKHIKNLN